LVIDPHEGQERVWDSDARFVLMLAGAQGGKTSFGPIWLEREIDRTASAVGGDNDYLAITTSFRMFLYKMLPEMRTWFEHVKHRARYWPGASILELCDKQGRFWAKRASDRMWGRVVLLSVRSPSGLEAITAKAAWMDELGQDEWTYPSWESIQARLALNEGRALGTTSIYNLGWLKTEWYDKWIEGDQDYEVVAFQSLLNPSFPKREYLRLQRTLPEWRFQMRYAAEWTRPAGLILGAFDEATMLVDEKDVDRSWERICSVDFGGANTAQVWLAEDPSEERWIVYDEYLGGGKSTQEHVDRTQVHDAGLDVDYYGGSLSEIQARMDWTRSGIKVHPPPVGDVEVGISRMIELFQTGRLVIARNCRGLRHEIATYKRKLDEMGQPTEVIQRKNEFHLTDGLRGAANAIFGPLEPDRKRARARVRG